jgi:lipid-A-disaccharide synthase
MKEVLVVAGEASGDRIASAVARVLSDGGVRSWGMGGDACARAGVRLVADLRASAGMGFTEIAGRLPAAVASYARLVEEARASRPRAALLVDYAEYNGRLGRRLRALGIPVMRCVAPQVWAWRAGRLRTAGSSFDRLATILPFEETLWRGAGVDARYVGHPSLDVAPRTRRDARDALGIPPDGVAVGLLPGSRRHEVRRLASRMLAALRDLDPTGRLDARIAVAPSLDEVTRRWLRDRACRAGVRTFDVAPETGAGEWLAAFDATVAASGTVTLESALAGAPPVIVYRVSALTAAIARRLVRVPSIGLPNIVLGRRVYPELVQDEATPEQMARALGNLLERRPTFEPLARELGERLKPPPSPRRTSPERIAEWMGDWLCSRRREQVVGSFVVAGA